MMDPCVSAGSRRPRRSSRSFLACAAQQPRRGLLCLLSLSLALGCHSFGVLPVTRRHSHGSSLSVVVQETDAIYCLEDTEEQAEESQPPDAACGVAEEAPTATVEDQAESRNGDSTDDGTHDVKERRRRSAARAALLSGRIALPRQHHRQERGATSVGTFRKGSASRSTVRKTTRLVDVVRKTAQGTSSAQKKRTTDGVQHELALRALSRSAIDAAVDEILAQRIPSSSDFSLLQQQDTEETSVTAAYSSFEPSVAPGTILLSRPSLTIRVATSADDVDIASLRLSVFANFTSKQQSQFCARSCQAIAQRRSRGALCVVATSPRDDGEVVVGSAECSFHEFFGTQLGRCRPQFAIRYVTEVAVRPENRRQGVGRELLQALEILSRDDVVETLYLHVDVANRAALALYRNAGYRPVVAKEHEAIYQEFTTSLNLQPGATQGRTHFLLGKHLTEQTWCMPQKLGIAIPS